MEFSSHRRISDNNGTHSITKLYTGPRSTVENVDCSPCTGKGLHWVTRGLFRADVKNDAILGFSDR